MVHRQFEGHAAILILASVRETEPRLLLTKRSMELTHHRGEVAFPGGMWEEADKDLLQTALRESNEEVALDPSDITEPVGELAYSYTRKGVRVKPFYTTIKACTKYLRPDMQEIDSLKWLSLAILAEDQRVQTDVFEYGGKEYWAPVYEIEDYRIWGFTSRVLVDYLNTVWGCNIEREHSAKECVHPDGFSPEKD